MIGNCHDNTGCSGGQICTNNSCVACTADNQCASGQLCISGSCTAGNCKTAADCNDTTKVCTSNNCGTCASNSDCTEAYGSTHVCNAGSCIAGNCLAKGDCVATGTICGSQTAFACGACGGGAAGDTQCANEYGAGHICNSGVCITGSCHNSSTCGTGQVCDLSSHTCTGCGSGAAGDTTCQGDAKYGSTYICQANACIVGNCHTAATCNNTAQVCNSFTCGMCSTNADCTNAYGANHVCSGGSCVSGNCNNSGQCGGNQLCINHACTACTAGSTGDAQCVGDTQYGAMHVCLGGQCLAGNCHDTSGDCTGGQICGISAAHTCGSCGSGSSGDTSCKSDTTYGSGDICLAGGCVQGDCHDTSTDCSAGKICGVSTAHTCGNCSAGSTGDTQCTMDTRYGSGDICFQGLCGAGNCHATSMDCTGASAGLICGASAANTCGSCSSDSQCKSDAFYGANDICNTTTGKCVSAACSPNSAACSANGTDYCCGGSCTTGNCCTDTDCGSSGTACVNHTCSSCNAVSGNKWYVDPVNGNDSTATGSDMAGSSVAPGCAFKTIKKLLNVMPSTPFAGTQIIIVGPASGLAAGETYPITLPANTTLTTSGGAVTIPVPAATLFQLNSNASAITGGSGAALVLDGVNHTGGIAILNSPGTSTFTSNISNLTIQNTNNDGIRVTAGTLTVGAGVLVSGSNQDGIRISGGAANINNPSGAQTLFTGNASHGIEVSGLGSVSITGTPGSVPSNSGTVVANFNTTAGIRINQTPGGVGLVTNNISGLVSWGNTNYGMRLFGGSLVKVRNSIFLGNVQYGVIVGSGANTIAGNDLSNLDLGKAGAPGKNYLQTPVGALGVNSQGGLCVALTACTGACRVEARSPRMCRRRGTSWSRRSETPSSTARPARPPSRREPAAASGAKASTPPPASRPPSTSPAACSTKGNGADSGSPRQLGGEPVDTRGCLPMRSPRTAAGWAAVLNWPALLALGSAGCDLTTSPLAPAAPTLTTGSPVTLLIEPEAGRKAVLDLLASARASLWMEMYLLTDGSAIAAIAGRAAAGCDVRVILEPAPYQQDGANQPAYDQLVAAGVDVRWSLPRFTYTHAKAFTIDHRRLAILTLNLTGAGLAGNREYAAIDDDPTDVAAAEIIFTADALGAATETPAGRLNLVS